LRRRQGGKEKAGNWVWGLGLKGNGIKKWGGGGGGYRCEDNIQMEFREIG